MVSEDPSASRAGALALVGGELALDFANTSSGRGWPMQREYLRSAADIVDWAGHAPVLPSEDAEWLREAMRSATEIGERLLAAALELREDIYIIGSEIAAGRPAPRGSHPKSHAHSCALPLAGESDAVRPPFRLELGDPANSDRGDIGPDFAFGDDHVAPG